MVCGFAASRATVMTGHRFPAIVDAALRIKATSFLIDGEAVIARDDGTPDFHALRSQRRGLRRCCTPSTCWGMTATTFANCR